MVTNYIVFKARSYNYVRNASNVVAMVPTKMALNETMR